jgi:hypothetical protein
MDKETWLIRVFNGGRTTYRTVVGRKTFLDKVSEFIGENAVKVPGGQFANGMEADWPLGTLRIAFDMRPNGRQVTCERIYSPTDVGY